jgi:hypothetical protein
MVFMKILHLSFLMVLLYSNSIIAQGFCVSLGEAGYSNYSNDIRICDGGYIIAGSTGKGNGDALMIRIDQTGKVIWQRNYGGSGIETGYRIATQDDGFLLLSRFQTDSGGNYGIWILKTDFDGNPLWDKQIFGNQWEIAEGMVAQSDGSFIVLSTRYLQNRDIILRKFDRDGIEQWQSGLLGPADEKASDILLAQNGNIYVAGEIYSGQNDLILAAFSTQGDSLFKKISGSIRDEVCAGITEHTPTGKLVISSTSYFEDGTGQLYLQRYFDNGDEDEKVAEQANDDKRIGRIVWNGTDRYLIPFSLLLDQNELLTGYYEFDHFMTFMCSVKLDGQPASLASVVIPGENKTGILSGTTENPLPSLPQIYVLKADSDCVRPPITLNLMDSELEPFRIFPNPSNEQIQIISDKLNANETWKLQCIDLSGREYFPECIVENGKACISVNSLPAAVYFFKLMQNEKVIMGKFIRANEIHD